MPSSGTTPSGAARPAGPINPRHAVHLDQIDALFPTCQIVYVVRDGRDVVTSHRDRWG
jgi:hypothetical protein